MLQAARPDGFAYNIPLCLRLSGPLDPEALQSACIEALRAHEALASAIVERDGRPRRRRLALATLPFAVHDTGHLSDEQLTARMSARVRAPFALDEGPLMRADLYSRGHDAWMLLIVVHHIAFDGGSVDAFLRTLCAAYARAAEHASVAVPVAAPVASLGFDDFVRWERAFVASDAGETSRRYWQRTLAGAAPALGLIGDPGGARRPRTVRRSLDTGAGAALGALCARLRITPAAFFLSMYQTLLASISGRHDVTVGMAVERRPHAGFDDTVGCFVNLVVVRATNDSASTLDDRLCETHARMAEALAHADYPFQRVARELRRHNAGQGDIFDTVFEYKSRRFFALQALQQVWAGVRFEPVEGLYQEGEYPLAFKVAEREGGYILYFDHDADRLPETIVDAWLHRLIASIEAALSASDAHPASLQIAPPSQEQTHWRPLHRLIREQSRRHPEALAAVHDSARLTYGELDARSDAIAARLLRAGVGADCIVALLLERSTDALCALLGVWKAGAAYLTLDPELPPERLRFMLEDAEPAAVITRQGLQDRLPCPPSRVLVLEQMTAADERDAAFVAPTVAPGQLAYIVYTSGSTGTPKGVALTHAGLANLARTQAEAFAVTAGDRVLQFAPWTFDASVWEIAMALQAGATLYLAPNGSLRRSGQLADLMQQARITVATLPPSAVTLLESVDLPHLRTLIVAGEECPPALAERWMQRCRFVNAYGPTETTVCATFKSCDPATQAAFASGSVPIGTAIAETTAHVLNPQTLRKVAVGEVGELFVGGVALARGYLRRAGLTAERFIADPFGPPGTRIYRTGDRARLLADGELQFVERADAQVKIRGSRVELGEVEAAAQSHPGVAQCAVVLLEERHQLAVFVVPSSRATAPDMQSLRRHIAARLPDYMVPTLVEFETQLPTNANGKVDRRALAARWRDKHFRELPTMTVRDRDIEAELCSIMAGVLRLEAVPLDEGFFDIGGDSILAVGVARRIAEAFDLPFDVTALLNLASVRRIGEHIAAHRAGGRANAEPAFADAAMRPASNQTLPTYIEDCVAIIGVSCDLPGARDHRQFWDNLRNGVESIEILSTEALRSRGVPEDLLAKPGLVGARATIQDKDCFDAEFFHVSAQDAQAMDPQLRMLLQHAWKAVEDAGYRPSAIADAGVFMTAANAGYHADAPPTPWTLMEGSKEYVVSAWSQSGSIPTLISHRLGLRGPSLFVHSNCSSSLVALQTAYRSLMAGDAKHALVGAASLSASEPLGYVAEHGMNFSSDGHLRPFDAGADGMLGGEGVAVLLLKRASEAIADNDPIYALLRGVAVNNDGADKAGYYAPSATGQANVIDKVLRGTGVDVETIDYIEAHGTATKLGDPLELAALGEAFGRHTRRRQFCGIGSVKSNIGHLDTVAGLAGCIKVALSLRHGHIPPSLNYSRPNPAIDFADSPFYVVDTGVALPPRAIPHRAGVSSFGIGGTNAHALLEEFRFGEFRADAGAVSAPMHCLVPLSARKPERLRAYAADLLAFLERHPDLDLRDVAHTLQIGREAFDCRLALEASTVEELCAGLRAFVATDASRSATGDKHVAAQYASLDAEDLARLLPHWVESGQWRKIAAAWTGGADIDWTRLDAGRGTPRRISLPTYPFAPTRYGRRLPAPQPAAKPTAVATLHPLLHHNTSSLSEHRYTTVFRGDEFVFADHEVRGARLLPGVAYLEMARAAVAQAMRSPDASIALSNVGWLRPLTVGPRPTTVHVRIVAREDAALSFQVYSELDSGEFGGTGQCLHCEGTATLVAEASQERFDLAALRARCEHAVSGEACYALFDKLGCRYGPSLRALVDTRAGDAPDGARFALGQLRLADDAVRDGRFVLHPGLLDSALQASIGMGLTGNGIDDVNLEQTLPFSIDRVRILHAPGEHAWVHVREAAGSSQHVSKLDVCICDDSGRVAVEILGLSARVVSDAAADAANVAKVDATAVTPDPLPIVNAVEAAKAAEGAETTEADLPLGAIPLVPIWDCLGPLSRPAASNESRRVLLVGAGARLSASLRAACTDAQVRELDADHAQDDAIALIRSYRPSHVVWVAQGADVAEAPDMQVLRCFRLTKALLHEGYETQPLRFSVITAQALAVRNTDCGDPGQAAVHGFIGSLAKEYPHWAVHAFDIDVEPSAVDDGLWQSMLEMPADPENSSIALREGGVYQRRLIPAVLPADGRTRIVEGGVYVVLGGAGGLGQAWTEYVLRHYRANVVWLGRRDMTDDIADAIRRLSGLGGSVRYLRVDARRRADLEAALKQIEAEHAVIHGFIHTALTLHDRSIMAVDEATFVEALSSKIQTGAALAAALARYRPADFVLFFSALQSFNPSPGQSSYAAGSVFIDATATWLRRKGLAAARVINWGYWGSVGIVASAAHRRRMMHIGEGSIESAEAMPFIESALSGPFEQLGLLKRAAPHGGAALAIVKNETMTVAPPTAAARFSVTDSASQVALPDAGGAQEPDEFDAILAAGLFFQISRFSGSGSGERSLASLEAQLAKPALYARWLREAIAFLCRTGYMRALGDDKFAFERPATDADWSAVERDFARIRDDGDESARAHADLIAPMLRALPDILAGRREATDVMFSNASLQRVEDVYKKNPFIDYFNRVVAALAASCVEQRLRAEPDARLRILEIGAGTGATSVRVFEALRPLSASVSEYGYTDISRAFLAHAEREYRAQAPSLRCRILDIERPLAEQGIDCGGYDIVIATNVLHATRDMHRTMRHVKSALGCNGLLIINEMRGHELFAHLTFGLLPGWWAYQDGWLREPGSPGLAPETWRRVLEEEGFRAVRFPVGNAHRFGQQIIIAESDGVFRHKGTTVRPAPEQNDMRPGIGAPPTPAPAPAPAPVPVPVPEPARVTSGEDTVHYVRQRVAEALEFPVQDVDIDEPFENYGIDSILSIRLANALRARFKDVSSTVVFEYPNVRALAGYLASIESAAPVAPAANDDDDSPIAPSPPPAASGALRTAVIAFVRTVVARTLEQPIDEIDVHEPLENYGVDSILAIRVANELRNTFHDVSSTVLFEHRSVTAIAEHFVAAQSDAARTLLLPPSFAETIVPPMAALPAEPLAAAPGALRATVIAFVRTVVARTLEQPIDEIDVHEPLENYGVDSILAIRVANELRSIFHDVSSTVLFEHRTVTAIADHFVAAQPEAAHGLLSSPTHAQRPASTSRATASIAAASPVPSVSSVRTDSMPSRPPADRREDRADAPVDARADARTDARTDDRAIAIVGISGRYPQAADIDAFWECLERGQDCVTEIPLERWPLDGFYEPDPAKAIAEGKSYCKWGGFIDGFADFDPLFFGIAPREAMAIDPHERLFLQETWRALEEAGYTRAALAGKHGRRVGVFAGISQSGFERCASAQDASGDTIHPQTSFSSVANRVSYLLDLQGPSMPIDTMCSSSLTAIHEACEHLLRDECEVAAAGGVNLNLHPSRYVASCEGRFLSTSGRCRSFGEGGDGFVPGEGVGVLILKRLARAVADGDHIHGVIRASGINHGGRAKGYTAPNPAAQRELVKATLRKAGIGARDISFVEAHGTGTELGDPIEIDALTQAFRDSTAERGFCAIGSVKSNLGHLEAAAGVAGVTKVLLQLKHKRLAPSLHAEHVNPHIAFESGPFRLQRTSAPWHVPATGTTGTRIASVSSFGAGGANAYLIVEEYIAPVSVPAAMPGPFLVLLSAKDDARLRDQARRLLDACLTLGDDRLAEVAYTLQVAREAMNARLACVVRSMAELRDKLERFLQERRDIDAFYTGDTRLGRKTLAWLRDDDDVQALVNAWLISGKQERLLEAWVNGAADIDWERLYPQAKPRRLSLPTYPFAQERYWIGGSSSTVPASGADAAAAAAAVRGLHPLVHRNTSTLQGIRFSSTFTGNEPIFADHVVAGQRLMPAVAYLEMARAAVTLATDSQADASVRISDVVWLKPVVAGSGPLELHIHVKPQGDDLVCEFMREQSAADESGDDPRHRSAPCVRATVYLQSLHAPTLDIAALRAATTAAPTLGETCYRDLHAMGVEYGPSHRGVVELQPGEDALGRFVLARLRLPSVASADAGRFRLHPSLLDSAVQAAGFDVGDAPQDNEARVASVPFALDSLQFFQACPSECWAVVRRAPSMSNVARTDIDLCDAAGRVCVRMQGLSGRTWRQGASPSAGPQTLFFAPAAPRSVEPSSVEPSSVEPAPDIADARRLLVACDVPAPMLATFAGSTACSVLESTATDPAERFTAYAEQLLDIVQTALRERVPTWLQLVVPKYGAGRLYVALAALLRGAEAESAGLRTRTIALDADGAEIVCADALREVELPAQDEALSWRDRGVYLVTGGLGGLGSAVVADITRAQRSATVVIAGRSVLGVAGRERLRQLASPGVSVHYRCVDVAHRAQVEELVEEIAQQFGALNGVLHCAGVASSRLVAGLSAAELRETLAAKVAGARNLDVATQRMPLDFFVLFSSLTARTGAIGQAAYATANAFLDEYAQYRHALQALGERSGRSLSIGWPYWPTDSGMQIPAETVDAMRRQGFVPLDAEAGMNALKRALAADLPQLAVAYGNPAQIRAVLNTTGAAERPAEQAIQSQSAAVADAKPLLDASRIADATAMLCEFLSRQLMIAPTRIHANDTFDGFGIDSIVAVRLTAALEKTHGPLSKTLFFEYANVAELAGYLATRGPAQAAVAIDIAADAAPAAPAPDSSPRIDPAISVIPRPAVPALPQVGGEIAIIGLAGRYPRSPTLEAFWENLRSGVDCVGEIPADRWALDDFYDPDKNVPGKSYCKWGGFIDGVADFDPKFFNISPREAPMMDPQERLFLMCTHEAMEDAGYTREALNRAAEAVGGGVGVFVGVMHTEYQLFGAQAQVYGEPLALGSGIASVANRVSYFGHFQGPSIAVDTMCSSSLTAIHLACASLRDGDCGIAIAGGVNVSLHPNKYLGLSEAKFASGNGRCAPFGEGGDGYVPGEGVGAVVLKPLARAIADGDRIYGVIKGSGVNHGGRSNGFAVPSAAAQAQLIGRVIERSGIDPQTIDYVEAHGTGTALGDPIEIAGLTRAFRAGTQDAPSYAANRIAIGSVKSNIGHCESAAGIAGLTKVLLQIQHATLVPTLHAERLNPNIDFAQTPFVVQRTLAPWPARTDAHGHPVLRTAAISSFGAGGSNAHLLVEEFRPTPRGQVDLPRSPNPALIVLSARDADRLRQSAQHLLAAVSSGAYRDADLQAMACTLQTGREHYAHRLGLSARSIAELRDKLEAFAAGDRDAYRYGVVDEAPAGLSALSADDLASLLDRGEEHRVLEAWTSGANCPWERLYTDRRPPKLRLPTYPFARERYWAPDSIRGRALPRAALRTPDATPDRDIVGAAHAAATPAAVEAAAVEASQASARVASAELRRVEEILRETLAESLYLRAVDVGLHATFVDLGMDSVMGVEWLPVIHERLGVSLGPTKIYEYPTLRDLAAFVFSQMPKAKADPAAPMPARHEPEARTLDDWLQAIYDGTQDPEDAQPRLTMPDADLAGAIHAQ